MKDQNYKNRKPLQLDKETHDRLKQLKRELSQLENKDLSMKEITKRVLGNEEIINRLRLGSAERRLKLK